MRLACVDCRLCRRQFGTDFSGGGDCVAVAQVQRSALRLRRCTSWRVSPKSRSAGMLTRPAIHRAPCGEPGARHDALRVVATLRDSACVSASEGCGRFVPRNERARLMRACRSARVDFSRMLTVGSAGATASPSSQTQTSIGRAAQDPQSRCAQRAEAAAVCSGLRRDAEHAFDRTSRMPGSRGCVTKPAGCRSAHLAANGAGLPRRETAATGAPNAIKGRGACAARVRDAAHARCETHITGSRHARSKCATRLPRFASSRRATRDGLSAMRPSRSPFVSTVRMPKEIDDEVRRLPSVSDYMCGFKRSSRTRRASACPRSAIRIQPMRGISHTRRLISLRLYFSQCRA